MTDLPLVSVVVPSLNRASYLRRTIDSIVQQDYPRVECIVVDGGSTDGSLEILKSYSDSIRWISEPDRGHPDAINKGWKMSQGQILAWLNADDLWRVPDAVSIAVAALQKDSDVDVIYGDCGAINDDGAFTGLRYLREWDLEYAIEFCDHCIPQPASFIRRSILEKVGWLDPDFLLKTDHELWTRIGLQGRILYVPTLLAYAGDVLGISDEGDRIAPFCIRLTRKFFSHPNVPLAIQAKKKRAVSNSSLMALRYAYKGGRHWYLVFWYAFRAAWEDYSNSKQAYYDLLDTVAKGAQTSTALRLILKFLQFPRYSKRLFLVKKR